MRRFLFSSLIVGACLGIGPGCASRAGRSLALYEAGDYAGAARAADDGLEKHPGDDDLWRMRIRAALALGDAAGVATSYASHQAQRDGDDRELLRELAIATVRQALASPSARLQILAIQAIEAAELHAYADEVADRMGDDNDRVAAAAAVAVLRGYPHAPQVAGDMLRSEDPEARRIAVEGIGKKVGELAAADLQRAATDLDPRVRGAAIRWLGQLKIEEAAPVLLRRMRDPDPGVRAAAATALARIGTGDLAALGTQALNDRALAVRLAGIELLAAAGQTQQLTTVAERDPDPLVAAEAAIAARRPELAIGALDRAATDPRPAIRAGAANLALRAAGKERALPLVQRLAQDPEPSVKLAAALAIATAPSRSSRTPSAPPSSVSRPPRTSPASTIRAASRRSRPRCATRPRRPRRAPRPSQRTSPRAR